MSARDDRAIRRLFLSYDENRARWYVVLGFGKMASARDLSDLRRLARAGVCIVGEGSMGHTTASLTREGEALARALIPPLRPQRSASEA